MRTLNLNGVFSSEQDEHNTNLYVLADEVDTGANSNRLLTKNKVIPVNVLQESLEVAHSDLVNLTEVKESLKYYMQDTNIKKIPQESFEKVINHKDEVTLTDIFAKLSELKSQFIYRPEFYKELTGGYSFADFTPDFKTARVSADKLIISNSKLNVVFVATMDGIVNINSFDQPMMRYVPFKIIKQGEVMFNYLDICVDNTNQGYLKSLPHIDIVNGVARLHLKKYKPFHASEFTIKSLVEILKQIASLKSVIRALNYYGDALKEYISREELYDNEWYRGEAVDDDYVSDEGTERLEIWIKGHKRLPSMKELFNSTTHLGTINLIKMTVDSTVDIYDFEADNDFKNTVEALSDSLMALYNDGEISDRMLHACSTLLKCALYQGTPIKRYEKMKFMKLKISSMLNSLELKLLPVRKKIIDTCDGIDVTDNLYLLSLGMPDGGTYDSIGIYSKEIRTTVMFRMTKITARTHEHTLTELPKIDTDPRSEL